MSEAAPIVGSAEAGKRNAGGAPGKAAAMGLAAFLSFAGGAAAQEHDAPSASGDAASLTLELNSLSRSDRGCRFTFVASNGLGGELSRAAFEMVLFDKEGMVSRMTVVDFKDLPRGKTKVRQFDFPDVNCDEVGRVLINDATDCSGEGIEPGACIRQMKTETRTEVLFGS